MKNGLIIRVQAHKFERKTVPGILLVHIEELSEAVFNVMGFSFQARHSIPEGGHYGREALTPRQYASMKKRRTRLVGCKFTVPAKNRGALWKTVFPIWRISSGLSIRIYLSMQIQLSAWKVFVWIVFPFLVFYLSSHTSPLYEISGNGDPIIYGIMGKGMVSGLVPYCDLFDQKGPFIFLIYAISCWCCGSYEIIFIFEALAMTAAMVFCYKISALFVSEKKALLVSMLLPFFICSFPYYAGGGNPSQFLLPFQFASIYYLYRLRKGEKVFTRTGFLFGISFGVAFLLKFNLIAFWCVPCVYGMHLCWHERKFSRFVIPLLLALIISILPFLIYFIYYDSLKEAWEGYIIFNIGYGGEAASLSEVICNYAAWLKREVMYPNMFLWVVGLVGIVVSRIPKREKWYYVTAFLVTCVGVQGNGSTHFPHYGHTLVPFATAGCLFIIKMIHIDECVSEEQRKTFFVLSVVGTMVFTILNCVNFSLKGKMKELYSFLNIGHFEKCVAVGEYGLWFYQANDIIPAIRTFTICASNENVAEKERMNQVMEIEAGKIPYIVVAGHYFDGNEKEGNSRKAMKSLLKKEYDLIRSVSRNNEEINIYCRRSVQVFRNRACLEE